MEHNFFYCERTALNFYSEPLNLITNIFFLYASIILYKKSKVKDNIFPMLIFFIGIGSALFHSIPNRITGLLDVFFIIIFIYYYLFCLYKKLNISVLLSNVFSLCFIFICVLFGYFFQNSILGSSSFYTPIVIHLILLSFIFIKHKNKYKKNKLFLITTLIFIFSITLRTIDKAICGYIPVGTHFIWHILNSIVLYNLIIFYHSISYRTSPKKPS